MLSPWRNQQPEEDEQGRLQLHKTAAKGTDCFNGRRALREKALEAEETNLHGGPGTIFRLGNKTQTGP